MIDNYDLWLHHERQQERQLDKLPKCDCCSRAIQDDYFFDVYGDAYCEKCATKLFRRNIEDIIN